MTSKSRRAENIHEIDKERSSIVIVEDKLYLRGRGICGGQVSPREALLLSEEEAYEWMLGRSLNQSLYGPRKECPWCASQV